MTRHLSISTALLSHWRRRPFQLLTLLVGLAVATALWSGVQALNMQARESYDDAARAITGGGRDVLLSETGVSMAQNDYIALRRAGWPVSPMVEGEVSIGGESYRLIGIDIVTLPRDAGPLAGPAEEQAGEGPRATEFLLPPFRALAGEAAFRALGGEGARPETKEGQTLPPIALAEAVAPGTIVTDIGAAQALLGRPGELTRLVVTAPPGTHDDLPPLESVTEGRLRLVAAEESTDLERLTDSFHLNLTAFGFLAFVVGLFIVHSAVGLAFEQRRASMRTMRACGVSARALTAVMLAEMVALATIAGLAGVVAGYAIASVLLPDVAASLSGLYGARVSGELALRPEWWLAGIAISIFGAVFAAGSSLFRAWRLPLFVTAQPEAWALSQRRTLHWQGVAAASLAVVAGALLLFGKGLVAGFLLMGATLLAAALFLPVALAALLGFAERRAYRPVRRWFFADARQQMGGLSLALMALLLALAVNVGVGTMVDSFRLTFTGWLDQRLAAELYVGAGNADEAEEIRDWLETRPEVAAVLPVWDGETRYRDFPVEIYGFRVHPTYSEKWPLIAATETVWQDTAAGSAVLISEQLARRFGLETGESIAIPTPAGEWQVEIGAIYTDYGNPRGQIMMAVDQLTARFPEAQRDDFAVRADPDAVPALMEALRARFGLGSGQMVDQASLKAFSQRIFERTFAVTLALNTLTLIVAGIALLASLLTLASSRLAQLAPLWALGLTRRELARLELAKALALALMTALLSLPLGLLVAWILMNVINVEAFGWRLPLYLFPGQWLRLVLLALLTAFVSAAWPAWKLRNAPPASLLKVFADER